MTRIIESFDEISDNYDVVFCDLWGCLHNGIAPFPAAVTALERFRDKGGIVLLLTNSPRPKASVMEQLDGIGVARDLYHEVASSGDSARSAVGSGQFGKKVYHLGPERDFPFFEPSPFIPGLADIERVPLAEAEGVVCTGLFDDTTETPDDYAAILLEAKNRGLKLICANPDVMVDRGDRRIYCAGAIAGAYTERGGESLYFGKPHPPIYDLARNRLTAFAGKVIDDKRILCIGDGINTDIRGGVGEGLDCLFITGGLAARETGTDGQPDQLLLARFLEAAQTTVTASIGHLR
ncbi:MAG: TIGR01459 family HAD-type hydrolase [Rhodobacteraceae bacterium]|nr:TIGR01459 family HAD-type hydrolase [Paracoccaceae bacterium]